MENASKALLMAGGILLALLIIGALVIFFTNLADYNNSTDASVKQSQIAEFNNQFEPYNKDDLTLMELKSVYNKIINNNSNYPEYNISSNITEVYPDINKEFGEIPERHKIEYVFSCTNVSYSKEGRINSMKFKVKSAPSADTD